MKACTFKVLKEAQQSMQIQKQKRHAGVLSAAFGAPFKF